jgi:hypothetical protein
MIQSSFRNGFCHSKHAPPDVKPELLKVDAGMGRQYHLGLRRTAQNLGGQK